MEMAQSRPEESKSDLTDPMPQKATKRLGQQLTEAHIHAKRKTQLAALKALDTTYCTAAKHKRAEVQIQNLEQQLGNRS